MKGTGRVVAVGLETILLILWYLALDVTANCICEILCLALDGFSLNYCSQTKRKNIGGAGI